MRRAPHPSARAAVLMLLATLVLTVGVPTAAAVSDPGAATRRADPDGGSEYPPVPPGTYVRPVDRAVLDPFRLPQGQYGPGNRGLEYDTLPGDPVRAIGAGQVTFAGQVAGRLVVSIVHPDGRRSSLVGLASLSVRAGELVARGTLVGTAAPQLHLGLREGERYVDPAPFLSDGPRRAVLVPVEGAGS